MTPRSKRFRPIKPWTVVEVLWDDAFAVSGDQELDEWKDPRSCIRKSIGYVVVDRPGEIVICGTDDRGNTTASHLSDALRIKRGMVVDVKVLRATD